MVTDTESSSSAPKRKASPTSPDNTKKLFVKEETTEDAEKHKRSDHKKGRHKERRSRRSRSRSHDRDRSRRDKRSRREYEDLDAPAPEYHRYYGEDEDNRQNSDRYWTKYPKKDPHQIGARYYDAKSEKQEDKGKEDNKAEEDKAVIPPRQRKTVDLLTSKTGGAYIPPAKLRMMQAEITDKTSAAYQRIAWEALKKSIHGYINKVNTSNIGIIARELLHENIVRGRGLLCKSIIQAQAASPTFTNVYAALVAVINSKFPNIGELLLKRLVLQFKRGFKQNNKTVCISAAAFIAHLVNQRVAHEILALQILTLLVESPTDDSVEVAIAFLKECGQKLTEVSSKGINAIFEMLRNILHEGQLEKRIQ